MVKFENHYEQHSHRQNHCDTRKEKKNKYTEIILFQISSHLLVPLIGQTNRSQGKEAQVMYFLNVSFLAHRERQRTEQGGEIQIESNQ